MTQTTNLAETYVQTLFSEDISAATYYIESGTECVIVDPSLVLTNKIKTILQNRAKTLKYILLTHIPSSYISGYLEYDNVQVIVGPGAQGNQTLRNLKENDSFKVGDLVIEYLKTGHYSVQSVAYLVKNQKGENQFILGGADLIYGGGVVPEIGNVQSHPSFQFPINGNVKVYPGYGASGYYRFIKDQSTIHTLQQILTGPQVDFKVGPYIMREKRSQEIRNTNLSGPFNYKSTKESCLNFFDIEQFDKLRTTGMILDIRQQIPDLQKGTVANSYVIPPNGNLGLFVYFLVQSDKQILIICKKQLRESILDRLLNIGCSNIAGFNDFTIQQWIDAGKQFYLPAFTSIKDLKIIPEHLIIDSRTPTEWKQEGIVQTSKQVYFPLIEQDIQKNKEQYKKYDKIYVYCRMGFRARIGASMFTHAGFDNVYVVPEPFKEIKEVVKIVPYQQ